MFHKPNISPIELSQVSKRTANGWGPYEITTISCCWYADIQSPFKDLLVGDFNHLGRQNLLALVNIEMVRKWMSIPFCIGDLYLEMQFQL